MYVLNRKTGIVQECHNNDAIKVCMKDTDNFAVSEKREELPEKSVKKDAESPRKEAGSGKAGNSTADTGKDAPGGADAVREDKKETGNEEAAKETEGNGGELSEEELKALSVTALKDMAKDKGIQGYGNMGKETLVAMIMNH